MTAASTAPVAAAAPRSTRREPVLGAAARHLVSRFTFGTTPSLVAQVRRRGRAEWFAQQLRPGRIGDPVAADVDTWWPQLGLPPADLWRRHLDGTQAGWELMRDYASWRLVRQVVSRRQLFEVMTAFWENHLHIPHSADGWVWRADYGRMIRRHALGRYEDLLAEAVVHPAMLVWLDGARSTKAAPNENLGRELLELFTLGVGQHSESDVKNAARILTGWRVDLFRTWARTYVPSDHWVGQVKVATFTHANADPDGRAVVDALLRHLARHPATARLLARKLATKFVSDTPSAALVEHLAQVYLANGTAIVPVLRALVASPEFAASAGAKLRDPAEDVVATYRAMQVRFDPPSGGQPATQAIVWQTRQLGLLIGDWPRPDGAPLENLPWATTLRALGSVSLHRNLAHGWWPSRKQGARHRSAGYWVPEYPIRLERLIDHASRLLLGRPASAAVIEAACLALELPAREVVRSPSHEVVRWKMGRLLMTVLDSPAHYHR